MRYVCEWDYMEPPHGKEAMNTEQKRAIAMGGYDKNPPLVGLAQVWKILSFFLAQFRSRTAGEIYAASTWDSVEASDMNNMSLTASKSGLRNFRNTLLTVLNCKNLSNKQYYLHIKLRNVPVYVPIYWYKLYRYSIQLGHRELSRKYSKPKCQQSNSFLVTNSRID